MTFRTRTNRLLPKALVRSAKRVGESITSRREFLATACSFGASAATAYAMIGLPAPARAAAHAKKGGVVRIE